MTDNKDSNQHARLLYWTITPWDQMIIAAAMQMYQRGDRAELKLLKKTFPQLCEMGFRMLRQMEE